jgi:hypothetical protein
MKISFAVLLSACLTPSFMSAQTPKTADSIIKKTTTVNTLNRTSLMTGAQPDLTLTITAVEKSANFYTVRFTAKNQGGGAVDLSKVLMQGNVYNSTGGLVTSGCAKILSTSGTLSNGQQVQGSIGCTINTALYDNETYIYRVTTDFQNAVSESNENNNTADMAFKGHTASGGLATAKLGINPGNVTRFAPDLAIEISTIVSDPANPLSFTVTYKIKNTGSGSIDLKKYAVQGYIREESVSNYSPCGGHSLMYEGINLDTGKEFTGTRHISATIAARKGYNFKIELKYQGEPITNGSPETNMGNNTDARFFSTGN